LCRSTMHAGQTSLATMVIPMILTNVTIIT